MTSVENAFFVVAGLSWQGALLIVFGAVGRLLLRRFVAPRLMFAGWLVVAGLLLLPWRVPVAWHPLAEKAAQPVRPAVTEPAVEPAGSGVSRSENLVAKAPVHRLAEKTPGVPVQRPVSFTVFGSRVMMARETVRAFAWLWLAGAVGLVLVRLVALARLHRALDRTREPVDVRLAAAVQNEASALGLKRAPEVVVTSLVETPALCGLTRPRLLFPSRFQEKVSAGELQWVVRHELGHLRRRDTWAQAWMQAACAVHWFNPLVWLAARLARQDCELACDEFVLCRHTGRAEARISYGQTLLKVLGSARRAPRLPAAVGIVEGRRQLMKRIALIADYRPSSLLRTLTGVALLAGAVCLGATQAAPTPPVMAIKSPPAATQPGLNAEAQAKIEAMKAEQTKWEEELKFELLGIGHVAGEPVAFIAVNGNLCTVVAHCHLVRYGVEEIDVENKRVRLSHVTRRGQPPLVLALTTPNPIKLPELGERQVEFLLSKEGIKLMNSSQGMPGELGMVWDKVNREGQVEVLTGYLRRGVVVGFFRSPVGGGTGFSSRLLERQISQRNKQRREVFLASLTPEQAARYNTAMPAIGLRSSPEERAKQLALAKAAQAQQAEVIAGLTAEQRALYDEYRSWLNP